MHGKHTHVCVLVAFSLQFRSHVSEHLIKATFARSIGSEAIFVIAKLRGRAGVRGDEYHLSGRSGTADFEQFLCNDDGAYRVCMEV